MKRSKSQAGKRTKKAKKGKSAGANHASVTIGGTSRMLTSNRPEYIKTVMRFGDTSTVDPGASTAGVYIYRANSIFDPSVTGGSLQPPAFDQYMALYQRFTVTKARIKVGFAQTVLTTPAWTLGVVGVALNTNGSPSGQADLYIANGDCNWTVVGRDYGTKTVTMEVDLQKYFATDIWNDDTFSGSVSADTARQCYWHIFCQGDEDMGLCHFVAELEYEVAFRNLKEVAFS